MKFNKLLSGIFLALLVLVWIGYSLGIKVSSSQIFSGILVIGVISFIFLFDKFSEKSIKKSKNNLAHAIKECHKFWSETHDGEALIMKSSKAYPYRNSNPDGKLIEYVTAFLFCPESSRTKPVIIIYDMLSNEVISYDYEAEHEDIPMNVYIPMKIANMRQRPQEYPKSGVTVNVGNKDDTKLKPEKE